MLIAWPSYRPKHGAGLACGARLACGTTRTARAARRRLVLAEAAAAATWPDGLASHIAMSACLLAGTTLGFCPGIEPELSASMSAVVVGVKRRSMLFENPPFFVGRKMRSEYILRALTAERLMDVAHSWKEISGEDEFEVELSHIFEWCESHLEHKDGDGYAVELYDVRTDSTSAVLELTNARRGALKKLFKLHLSPAFWDADLSMATRLAVVDLYVAAFFQVISNGVTDGCNEVKIYGRNETMMEIITMLQERWPRDSTGWSASMQGRWLSIAKN